MNHVKKAYKAYKWLQNKHEKGVKRYNQLLKNKKAIDEDNSRLRQKQDEQKKSILRMEKALTYVEEQMVELQTKQHCKPTPLPPSSTQAMPPPAMPPPATLLEPTLIGESKKIIVVSDPSIFNGDKKEKKGLYDHWLLQMHNKMTANEKIIPTEILKKAYVQS